MRHDHIQPEAFRELLAALDSPLRDLQELGKTVRAHDAPAPRSLVCVQGQHLEVGDEGRLRYLVVSHHSRSRFERQGHDHLQPVSAPTPGS